MNIEFIQENTTSKRVKWTSSDSSIAELKIGESLSLEVLISPANADDKVLMWSVDNKELVVMEGLLLMAKKLGTVIVTVTTVNNKQIQ